MALGVSMLPRVLVIRVTLDECRIKSCLIESMKVWTAAFVAAYGAHRGDINFAAPLDTTRRVPFVSSNLCMRGIAKDI